MECPTSELLGCRMPGGYRVGISKALFLLVLTGEWAVDSYRHSDRSPYDSTYIRPPSPL